MSSAKIFYGDKSRWFIATVESTTPQNPAQHGKVQIRIHDLHHNENNGVTLKGSQLPWATVAQPATSGRSTAPSVSRGDLVYGMFLDGPTSQIPVIFSVIPTNRSSSSAQNENGVAYNQIVENLPTDDSQIGDGYDYSDVTGTRVNGDPNPSPIIEILDVGAGWNVIKRADGSAEKRTGNRNWRNNNPGNIEYGDFTKSRGAIGSDGRFAIFPTYATGREAKHDLIFTTDAYKYLTLSAAIAKYAPAFENDTSWYARTVIKSVGVNQQMYKYTTEQRNSIMNAMEKVEGYIIGRVEIVQEQKLVDDTKKFPILLTGDDLSQHINSTPRDMPKMVVHWTETYNDKYLTATDIDDIDKKSNLDGIQYHLVIRRDGTIQGGRDIDKPGLDGAGTISVCFVGGLNCPAGTKSPQLYKSAASITQSQFRKFDAIVKAYLLNEPTGTIVGRTSTDPGFDVTDYVKKFKK